MGIALAIMILGGADGGHHGGVSEAVDELIRHSSLMSTDELRTARDWAAKNGSTVLAATVATESAVRRAGGPVHWRAN